MEDSYNVYSKFDIKKHKERFINYLEVLILEDGTVEYAVPSHQMKAEALCCKKLNITRTELISQSTEHLFDYAEWLLTICNAIMVWNGGYLAGNNGLNNKQKTTLKRLKLNGLYRGKI